MLDEKKCTTTKNAVDHILTRLMQSFGVQKVKQRPSEGKETTAPERPKRGGNDDDSGGEDIEVDVMLEPYSEDDIPNSDVDMRDEGTKQRQSSQFVSTIRNPSFGAG